MVDLYDEVAEDIKQSRHYNFFKKAFKPLFILFAITFFAALAFLFFSNMRKSKIEESGDSYYKLQNYSTGSTAYDGVKLNDLIQDIIDDENNYSALTMLFAANRMKDQGNEAEAIKLYDELRNDKSYDKIFQDLAFIQYIAIYLNSDSPKNLGAINDEALLEEMDEYLGSSPIFKYSALEMKAHLLVKLDRFSDAQEVLQSIIEDEDAPEMLVARSQSIIGVIS